MCPGPYPCSFPFTRLSRTGQSSQAGHPAESTRAMEPPLTTPTPSHSNTQYQNTSLSECVHGVTWCYHTSTAVVVPAAVAGAAASSLAAATGASGGASTAQWAVGGSMRSAALCLPGPRACCGAVWVCAAAECALCSNLPPCALNGVRHESSSINYARESMLPKFVAFQMQLLGVNGLF